MPGALPPKVLMVRLGALGDVVNALVLATALKEAKPAIEIGWAVHPLSYPLVDGHPAVDRVHVWHRPGAASAFAPLLRGVRARRYDLALDLQRISKSALLAKLSGAPRVIGFDRARCKELSWWLVREHLAPADPRRHMVLQYLEFARHLGVEVRRPRRVLPRVPEAEAWAEERVLELGSPPVVLAVGTSRVDKCWPPERFGALAARVLGELRIPVVLTGGAADRPAARSVAALAGGATDLVGRTSLSQLVSLLARARAFVGGDTGPMHAAAALDVPVVALFGPTDPARLAPFGEGHQVIAAAGEGRRMRDITVERVVEALHEVFAARATAGR